SMDCVLLHRVYRSTAAVQHSKVGWLRFALRDQLRSAIMAARFYLSSAMPETDLPVRIQPLKYLSKYPLIAYVRIQYPPCLLSLRPACACRCPLSGHCCRET